MGGHSDALLTPDKVALRRIKGLERWRRRQDRARRGVRVIDVEVSGEIIDWLVHDGRISEAETLDDGMMSAALSRFLLEVSGAKKS